MFGRHFRLWLIVATLLTGFAARVGSSGAAVYVDNRRGRDAYDGRTPEPASPTAGPVRTIRRGLQLAGPGETVVVANTGFPYYESLTLFGARNSGFATVPFTIIGNGAVVDGACPVPPFAWREVASNLWQMTPWRKGHYQLLLGDEPVPEHRPAVVQASLPELPAGHWTAWRGSIYYRAAPDELPALRPFRFACHGVGLTLYRVHDVRVTGLTFRNFRVDGVNAHDLCRRVLLEDVAATQNGRAGVAVGGSAGVILDGCELVENRLHSLLVTEHAAVEVEGSKLDQPPTQANVPPTSPRSPAASAEARPRKRPGTSFRAAR